MSKITIYKNGTVSKIKNRRMSVSTENDGVHTISMKVLDGSIEPRSEHTVMGGKIVQTTINLTVEGAEQLMFCLYEELTRGGKHYIFRQK